MKKSTKITRDKKGKFTRPIKPAMSPPITLRTQSVPAPSSPHNLFLVLFVVLVFSLAFNLVSMMFIADVNFKVKDTLTLKKEAVERGFAIEDQGHFLWIEERKAIIQ